VNLGYIISAYKHPEQLIRLVRRLEAPGTSFFIHIDRKTDKRTYEAIRSGLVDIPVIFLARHVCQWGGFGHVAATLEGIRAIVGGSTDCDRVILLTGQDYPIRSPARIQAFFADHPEQEYIEHSPLPYEGWERGGMERIRSWHWRVRGRHLALSPGRLPIRRSIPGRLRPYGGSSYWCLTRPCLAYIDAWTRTHATFVDFFRRVDVPDELFFQTIVLNSPFASAVVDDDLRYIAWEDSDAASPTILTMAHLPALLASSDLYARKFDPSVDPDIIEALDRSIDAETAGGASWPVS
jgi:Core-2/I-Branching enzyme